MADPTTRTTRPPARGELEHDVSRAQWAERTAYQALLDAIARHPDTAAAHERWTRAHAARVEAEARLDALVRGGAAAERLTPKSK